MGLLFLLLLAGYSIWYGANTKKITSGQTIIFIPVTVAFFMAVFFFISGHAYNQGTGNPRSEFYLEKGHPYYVVGYHKEIVQGGVPTILLYDKIKNEILSWEFDALPPKAFIVEGNRKYKEIPFPEDFLKDIRHSKDLRHSV